MQPNIVSKTDKCIQKLLTKLTLNSETFSFHKTPTTIKRTKNLVSSAFKLIIAYTNNNYYYICSEQ